MQNDTDHNHAPHIVERVCDVVIVGGSAAGLAAALQICRQRRSVIVVDAGEPRNAPASHMHGFLGRDGTPPTDLTTAGRAEVRSYGGEVLDGRVQTITLTEDGRFRAELTGGHAIVARKVLAATGLVDELPGFEGVAEHWGRGVIHCPICHGYEVRDQKVVQIITHPMGLHPAVLFRQLTAQLTIVVHNPAGIDEAKLESLAAGGVTIVSGQVQRIVAGPDGEVSGVALVNGQILDADAAVVGPRFRAKAEPFAALGLEMVAHMSGLGDFVETDPTGATSIPGLYAAGNVTDPAQQVLNAAANGSWVGAMIGFSLADEDLDAAGRPSANAADWDLRFAGDQIFSGNPNGTLVNEISGVVAGRALDVGAGEGGDAIWLAEQGWAVTASDISERALVGIAAEAQRRDLRIECQQVDANTIDAFETEAFDLVTAHYASIPRTPDGRSIENLLKAVAPGGTLLIVGHDIEPMRRPIDTKSESRVWDPEAFLRPEHISAALRSLPDWVVEVDGKRPRPPGAASSHHVDDIVVRARRGR